MPHAMTGTLKQQSTITPWSHEDGTIRVTATGQPSVFDMIRVLGGYRNPQESWGRLIAAHPEVESWTERHLFPGRGQRLTPVLKDPSKAEAIFHLASCSRREKAAKSAGISSPLTEKALQKGIALFLTECGESPRQYVSCSTGVADIVSNTYVVEVKNVTNWKAAIGQAIVYANELGKFPKVALFGRGSFELAMKTCTRIGIGCSCYPSDHPCTAAMIKGRVYAPMHNIPQLQKQLDIHRTAHFN